MTASKFKKNVILLGVLAIASPLALAEHDDDNNRSKYGDYARVVSSTPEYTRVNNPRQECTSEYIPATGYRNVQTDSGHSYTGTIVGGIAGALIGSRLGKGNGNRAATAAGAIAGAVIGDQVQSRNRRASDDDYADSGREARRCRVVDNWDQQLTGYRVVYEYAGRSYTTVLPQDPGRNLPVKVSVTPAVEQLSRSSYR